MGPSFRLPPPKKRGGAEAQQPQQRPKFHPCLLWPNGWMDHDATSHGCRHRRIGDIVLDGDQVLPQGHSSPHFSVIVYCGQTTVHQDTTWYGGMPREAQATLCQMGTRQLPPPTERSTAAPPHFSAHFALARLPISATAEFLFVFILCCSIGEP